jgi:hypothetical protein
MPLQTGFQPQPWAEAAQSDIAISDEAAVSRLRPIQDGLDYWQVLIEEHRSSADTGSRGSAPGEVPAMFGLQINNK